MASLAQAGEASTSRSAATATQPQQQVPLTLKTSIPELSLPPTSYLVPTSFSRTQLSTLVNRLLAQTSGLTSTIPFDFIVDGQLLRESLDSWLDKNGKTVEEGIELEYIKSTLPPKWAGAFEHDDWIASIDASRDDVFLTASYDSCIRLFSYSSPQAPLLTHKVSASGSSPQSLVDARWVGSSSGQVATAGLDGSVRLFAMPEADTTPASIDQTYTSQPKQQWYGTHHVTASKKSGHSSFNMSPSALTSIAASSDGQALLSASRDGSLAYWKLSDIAAQSTEGDAEDDDSNRKRRKGVNGKASSGPAAKKPTSLLWHAPPVLSGEDYVPSSNARVSRAIFSKTQPETAYSAGYDGKIIEWDLFSSTQGGNAKMAQKTSDKVILDMDQMTGLEATLVTGHMDRSIGIWDMRSASANISLLLPNAHQAPVYTVSAHPISSHLLCSASGDGIVKLFDTRSPRRALFSLARPQGASGNGTGKEKLLASDWDRDGQVVLAGGEDCKVNVFKGEGIGIERAE